MNIVTADEMRAMDRQTIESFGIPGRILMENAGRDATRILREHFSGIALRRIGVMAGRGNNGGDGFVIARYLANAGIKVNVYLLSKSASVAGDAAANLKLLAPMGIPVIELPDIETFSRHKSALRHMDLWVDAILGTGLKSSVKGHFSKVIDFLNRLNKPIFAVDIPSGLNSDTGQPCGSCISAQATATFAFAKAGQVQYPGVDYCGKLHIIDIGIPNTIVNQIAPRQYLLTAEQIGNYLRPRSSDTHKGKTGHLLVLAGSAGKTGAAAMTATSALRAGAGLVTVAIPQSLNPVLESLVLEAMTEPLPEKQEGILGDTAFAAIRGLISGKKALALGPGLGQSEETKKLVLRIIEKSTIPVIVDADGLNHLAGNLQMLSRRKIPIILTPHPGEMARLINSDVSAIQQDRIGAARELSVRFKVHTALKGAATVLAHPDGKIYINSSGNSGMAAGGMGDVLTGVIAGFLTQGYTPKAAMHAGVYLHGAAADTLAKRIGPFGFLAHEVMDAIPGEICKLVARNSK
jgi:NAD(P)H-hydrate epimerase